MPSIRSRGRMVFTNRFSCVFVEQTDSLTFLGIGVVKRRDERFGKVYNEDKQREQLEPR